MKKFKALDVYCQNGFLEITPVSIYPIESETAIKEIQEVFSVLTWKDLQNLSSKGVQPCV